ncbi:GspE/PulE family protein [Microbulbifer sp. CNSA002]|uniref:GspE/PulE family protein n=1 Tax=unclassified Microbulbifer TaxID=2619833 RepID=UPI0039B4912E
MTEPLSLEDIDIALVEGATDTRWWVERKCLPLTKSGNLRYLAGYADYDPLVHQEAEDRLQNRVFFRRCSEESFMSVLEHLKRAGTQLRTATNDAALKLVVENSEGEVLQDIDAIGGLDDAPVVKLLNTLIVTSLAREVSDIHIETYEAGVEVKYRIHGQLYPATDPLEANIGPRLVSRIKVISDLNISERRVPQDGSFKLVYQGRKIDFRVSVIPAAYGENAVIRVLDNKKNLQSLKHHGLEDIGLEGASLHIIRKAVHAPYGMVLVSGPTGSGKSTTLHAAICEINTGHDKIVTIEDPVEYQIPGVMQIPVNEDKGLTFSVGLRSLLRHDPDKILVGEIRDQETAKIALQLALTGHLVMSTVHANDARDVLFRLENIGLDRNALFTAVKCIVSQRLIRLLCEHCKIQAPGVATEWAEYTAVGCAQCAATGYSGRTIICEVIEITDELRVQLSASPNSREVLAASVSTDNSLRAVAVRLLRAGLTSRSEIDRVTLP